MRHAACRKDHMIIKNTKQDSTIAAADANLLHKTEDITLILIFLLIKGVV